METEIIKAGYEDITILDDRLLITKDKSKEAFSTLNPTIFIRLPGYICVGLMINSNNSVRISGVAGFLSIIVYICVWFIFYESRKSMIYKKDIIKSYINKRINCLFFKFKHKGRTRIRRIALPVDINEREKTIQVLYEKNLLNKEFTSQIVKMKEGYLYVRDKDISFVDFKLYSQHIDAGMYKNGTYELLSVGLFASCAGVIVSVVSILFDMIICCIICVIVSAGSLSYWIFLYRQFINSKTFLMKRNKIAGFLINNNNNQMLMLQYYTKNKLLRRKTLVLSDITTEKNTSLDLLRKEKPLCE
jgi:hypothetical protein